MQLAPAHIQRLGQPVDLHARVVHVELPVHVIAGPVEQGRKRIADRGATRVRDVQRSGRVGRHELDHHPARPFRCHAPECGAAGEDLGEPILQHVLAEPEIEEAGARDLDGGDARTIERQARTDVLGDRARRLPEPTGERHRQVRRDVAVLRVARPLEPDLDAVRGAEIGGDAPQLPLQSFRPRHQSPLFDEDEEDDESFDDDDDDEPESAGFESEPPALSPPAAFL